MTTTVAIVTRDRRASLERCLAAVVAQTPAPDQLLVIDNGSSDGSAEAARAAGAEVHVHPGTLGEIRADAVARATGELLVFVDDDAVPDAGWLAAITAPFARDERLGVVQGRTLPQREPVPGRWETTQQIESESLLFECVNLAYRTAAIREADGFDAAHGYFGEDCHAGWSVVERGWRHAFAEDAVVRHETKPFGFTAHARARLRYGTLNELARRHPAMRTQVFHRRVFRTPDSAWLALAAAGALTRRPLVAAATAAPYVVRRHGTLLRAGHVKLAAQQAALDVTALVACARGSARHRSLLL